MTDSEISGLGNRVNLLLTSNHNIEPCLAAFQSVGFLAKQSRAPGISLIPATCLHVQLLTGVSAISFMI